MGGGGGGGGEDLVKMIISNPKRLGVFLTTDRHFARADSDTRVTSRDSSRPTGSADRSCATNEATDRPTESGNTSSSSSSRRSSPTCKATTRIRIMRCAAHRATRCLKSSRSVPHRTIHCRLSTIPPPPPPPTTRLPSRPPTLRHLRWRRRRPAVRVSAMSVSIDRPEASTSKIRRRPPAEASKRRRRR